MKQQITLNQYLDLNDTQQAYLNDLLRQKGYGGCIGYDEMQIIGRRQNEPTITIGMIIEILAYDIRIINYPDNPIKKHRWLVIYRTDRVRDEIFGEELIEVLWNILKLKIHEDQGLKEHKLK